MSGQAPGHITPGQNPRVWVRFMITVSVKWLSPEASCPYREAIAQGFVLHSSLTVILTTEYIVEYVQVHDKGPKDIPSSSSFYYSKTADMKEEANTI